jgi:hypothetical protein
MFNLENIADAIREMTEIEEELETDLRQVRDNLIRLKAEQEAMKRERS